jgi:hypothetical protein
VDLTIVHLASPSGVCISEDNTATLKLGVIAGTTLGLPIDKSEGYTVESKLRVCTGNCVGESEGAAVGASLISLQALDS